MIAKSLAALGWSFRALDMLASLWSSTGMSPVSAGAAPGSDCGAPYRTLFTTLRQLLVGKEVTVRIGDHDVVLTVTSWTRHWNHAGLAVGQLGSGFGWPLAASAGISIICTAPLPSCATCTSARVAALPLVIAAPVEVVVRPADRDFR